MRAVSVVIALGAVVPALAFSGCGGSGEHTVSIPSQPERLPSTALQAIEARYPEMDYVPSRLPKGFRFIHLISTARSYVIQYAPKTPRYELTTFAVGIGCDPGHTPMRSFAVNGRSIKWSATYTDQSAWLCMTTPQGKQIMIETGGSVPGGDAVNTHRGLKAASLLADLIGWAEPASGK